MLATGVNQEVTKITKRSPTCRAVSQGAIGRRYAQSFGTSTLVNTLSLETKRASICRRPLRALRVFVVIFLFHFLTDRQKTIDFLSRIGIVYISILLDL